MAAERWLSVGEASRLLGMSRTTLLAAEEAGLVTPIRTPGGHRRYGRSELDRYLGRSGTTPALPDPAPPAGPPAAVADMAAAVRAAVRPLARALDADAAGCYLLVDGSLRFSAAVGVPRWLAERLGETAAPRVVAGGLGSGGHRLFDAATTAFPEPRSTGHGLTAALRRDGRTLGVLFLLRGADRELLPAELRIVDAFAELVAGAVADRQRIAELEARLARIAALAG